METLSTTEFNKLEISLERESETVYFIRLTEENEEGYKYGIRYDLGKEKVLESDVKLSEDQLDMLHDEVAERYADDLSEERMYERDPYRRYGLNEEMFL